MENTVYSRLLTYNIALAVLFSVLAFMLLDTELSSLVRSFTFVCAIAAWAVPAYGWYLQNEGDEEPSIALSETQAEAPAEAEPLEDVNHQAESTHDVTNTNVVPLQPHTESLLPLLKDAIDKAQRSKQQSTTSLETLQALTEASRKMDDAVNAIASKTAASRQIVEQSVVKSDTADSTSQSLQTAASRIGKVLQLIQEIAEQINLLALNATIEAARAGDAGKGFAVVASEVKNLASQTAKATEEIGAQVQEIQTVSEDVVHTLSAIKEDIMHVAEHANDISGAVEQQKDTTKHITEGLTKAQNESGTLSETIDAFVTSAHEASSSLESETRQAEVA